MALIYTPSYKRGENTTSKPVAPSFPTVPTKKRSLLERTESIVKGVGIDPLVGILKSGADTALGFGELGQKIFNPWSWAGNKEAKKSQEFAKGLRESKYVAPQTTGESVGFVGGKIAQALAPGMAGVSATRAAASLPAASTAVRAAAGFAAEAAPQTLLAAGQEGSLTKNALVSGLLSGVGGVGGKIPNAAIGLGQVGYGAKQIADGDISGGAMNIGFGALGLRGAAKTKGLLVNRQVIPPNQLKAAKQAADTIDTILGAQPREAKISQRKALAGQTAKTPGQIAADHGVFGLDTDANGRLDTTKARQDIQTKVDSWEDTLTNALDKEYNRNSLTGEMESVISDIKAGKVSGIKSASDRKAAITDIQQFFADEIEAAGDDLVSDYALNQVKRGLNSAYKGGEPRLGYEAQRAARSRLQTTIENNVDDVKVRQINQMMGELFDLDRSLKNKQGMAVQGGKLTKKLNGIIGGMAGSYFGPFGTLAGAQAAEAATDFAVDPYRRAMAQKRNLDLSGFVQPGQKLRDETAQAMQARVQSNLTGEGKPKMLPAPSAIYAPAQTSTGPKMMSQRDAVDSLRSTGSLPSEGEIRAAMSGSPLKRMELLQRIQSEPAKLPPLTEPAVPKAQAGALPAEVERAVQSSTPLYHGTAQGGFDKFDNAKMRSGNQGEGIYLTTSPDVAKYSGYAAQIRAFDKANSRMPNLAEQTPGSTLSVAVRPDAKIKKLDYAPTPSEVLALKKEGFDGITFPDDVVREDWNTELHGPYPKKGTAETTVVFDAKSIDKVGETSPNKELPAYFERSRGLSDADRAIEEKAFREVLSNEKSILDANKAKYGNVINTDNFRPAFKEQGYAGYNAAAVQEPSSYLAKKARTEALKNPGADAITFAGGSGTGKTSAIKGIPELKDQQGSASVVMDGNLSSYSSASKWLREARAAGKKTPIWYVYRDPMDAFENGIVKRMLTNKEEGGRLVPTKVTAGNHIGSWEVVQKLKKEGFDVIAIDNSLGANKARVIPFVEMQKKINYPSERKLAELFNKKAKELLDKGTITQEQYEGYIR